MAQLSKAIFETTLSESPQGAQTLFDGTTPMKDAIKLGTVFLVSAALSIYLVLSMVPGLTAPAGNPDVASLAQDAVSTNQSPAF